MLSNYSFKLIFKKESDAFLMMGQYSMRKQTLELCHCLPLSGHMGQIKTMIKLKQNVLWYRMARDWKLFVKSCKFAIKIKVN